MGGVTQKSPVEGRSVLCHGLRIGFEANDESVFHRLDSILPPGSLPISPTELDFRYSLQLGRNEQASTADLGPKEFIRARSLDRLFFLAASHLERTIAEYSPVSTFIHAGVIGWRGRAILFPGRSGTGKSTLVRALLRLGALYFSDEFAAIDSEGLVHPFARPLSLRVPGGRAAVQPDQLGAEIGAQPFPAGAVIITRYAPNGVWQPVLVSRGRAVLELLRNAVAVRSDPARSITRVKLLIGSSVAIRSVRSEAERVADLILNTVDKFATPWGKEICNGTPQPTFSYPAAGSWY